MNARGGIRRRRRRRPLRLAVGVVLVAVGGAQATLPQQSGLLNLAAPGSGSIRISGAIAGDRAGESVAGIGDFDGDGARDVLVGAFKADPFGRADAGTAYVAFGPFTDAQADLGATQTVLRIDGAAPGDQAGVSVAAAGDVNGDGRPDVVVGAHATDPGGRISAGSAYVVFGAPGRASVDLAALGTAGFRVDGAAAGDELGAAVAGVGDVNGDGYADVLVGARQADNNDRVNSGSAYLVFGGPNLTDIDVANAPGRVARMDGATVGDAFGARVAPAGDANGDGRQDLLIGVPRFDPGGLASGRQNAGAAYVVFGSTPFTDLDLGGPGATTRSFRIDGAAANDDTGQGLAAIGDTDGDGRSEILVGAPGAEVAGRLDSGAVFMVRGASDTQTVDLADLGARAVRVDGALSGDQLGISVAAVGDITGDGRGDLLFGANGVDVPGVTNAGGAFLVTALPFAGRLDLAQPEGAATVIRGGAAGDTTGSAVAAAGDLTGDGRPDALIGSRYADPAGRSDAGAVEVVLGYGQTSVTYPDAPVSAQVGAAITPIGPSLVRRTGAAAFTVQPALPAGMRLDPVTGVISGVPSQATPRRTYTVTMTDLAGSAMSAVSLDVTAAVDDGQQGIVRSVPLRGLRLRCIPSRVVGRACRVQVVFSVATAMRVRIELTRVGASRVLGAMLVRTRPGLNRVMLPLRFGARRVGAGAYRVHVRGISAPLAGLSAGRVVVKLRRGGPTR